MKLHGMNLWIAKHHETTWHESLDSKTSWNYMAWIFG